MLWNMSPLSQQGYKLDTPGNYRILIRGTLDQVRVSRRPWGRRAIREGPPRVPRHQREVLSAGQPSVRQRRRELPRAVLLGAAPDQGLDRALLERGERAAVLDQPVKEPGVAHQRCWTCPLPERNRALRNASARARRGPIRCGRATGAD